VLQVATESIEPAKQRARRTAAAWHPRGGCQARAGGPSRR
jgi:hypothetical protein